MDRITGQAGEILTAFDLCYLKADGKYWKADPNAAATMPGSVLASVALAADEYGLFITKGVVTNAAWTFATVGGTLYADDGTAGLMSQTPPNDSNDVIQICGIYKGNDTIDFDPQLVTVVLA